VRAEQIKVIGNVKAQGNHELVLESLYGTTVKVGDLNPNITIRAKDFYGQGENTITITDQAFLQNFCSSDYKASGLTGKAQMRFEEEQRQRQLREQAAALNLNVYPNPASTFVQIAVQNQPQQITDVQLVLSDLTGRQILAEEQAANASGRYVLNLPELATGVYMLQVTAGDKTAVEKIAVQ
jgi:N-methylhydantoinase A/oxoprolinase/acetone carboxylase beta subunit